MTSLWQADKRILDHILPAIEEFASKHRASLTIGNAQLNLRLRGRRGMYTIQLLVMGRRVEEQRLEVCGFGTSGIEILQCRFPILDDINELKVSDIITVLEKIRSK